MTLGPIEDGDIVVPVAPAVLVARQGIFFRQNEGAGAAPDP
jgi:hypothetical protein